MSSLTLRIRCGTHVATLTVSKEATLGELQELISAETGVSPAAQLLHCGVPPKVLPHGPSTRSLVGLGCSDRDTILVKERVTLPVQENAVTGAKKRTREVSDGDADSRDVPESELLPAFDRAIKAATEHAKMLPEDKHQVFALRRGKAAVIESLKRGDNISLGALHTLTGVGHWVVQQIREQLEGGESAKARRGPAARQGSAAPPPTPNSFTWWYLGKNGKPVVFRNDAQFTVSGGAEQFRVCISHSSGRIEKAWLPDAKAPARSQGSPPGGHSGPD